MIIPLDSAISLASIKAYMTLHYFIGLFRIKLLTWHNQESTQWSPDPFHCEKAASEHETISSYDSPAASWLCNLEGEARLGDCLNKLSCQLNPYCLHRLFSGWHYSISSFCHHLCSALSHCVGTAHHWTGSAISSRCGESYCLRTVTSTVVNTE